MDRGIRHRAAFILTCIPLLTASSLLRAEDIRPDPDKPSLDRVLEDLAKIDPQVLSDRLTTLRSTTAQLKEENAALQARIARNQQELTRIDVLVRLLDALVQVRGVVPSTQPAPVATAPAAEPAKQAAAVTPPKRDADKPVRPAAAASESKPQRPSPGAAKQETSEAKPDTPPPAQPVALTYSNHVRPLIDARCANCHNPEKAKSGLVLVTYAALMKGGESGAIVIPGKPDESRLYRVIAHAEEPHMPPKQGKLDADKLDLVRRWIEAGAVEGPPAAVPAKAAAAESGEGPS